MIASTRPAINGERSKIGVGTSKNGIKPKYLVISFAQYSADDIKTKNPQKPKRSEGKAAIKSMTEIRNFFTLPFA
jgi:hypothetical protein